MTRLQPSFLICSERSGSNLIRAILNAHPEVYAPQPIHLGAFWARVAEFGELDDDAAWRALLTAIVEFLAAWKGKLDPELEFTVDGLAAAIPRREFVAIYEHLYARGLSASGKRRLFIKENHTAQRAGLLLPHWPRARFVFQVRDPRDFLASCKQFPNYKYGGPEQALAVWSADQTAALELGERLAPDQLFEGRYEELIEDPEPYLRRLCEFLAVEFAPEMLAYHETEDARRSATHEAWRNIAKPIIKTNSGRYRARLERAEIALVEARAGELMARFGYAPAELAPAEPEPEPEPRPDPASGAVDSSLVHAIIDRHVGAGRSSS